MSGTQKQAGELFAGTLYLEFLNEETGEFGSIFTVETDKLEIKTPSTLVEATSKSRERYGQTHTDARVPKPTEFSIVFTEVTRQIMAAKLSGVVASINQAQLALSSVTIQLKALDEWVSLGHEHITEAGFLVKDSTGTTTYVKDVDYEINPRLGLIRPLSGGDIAANASVKITGNRAAVTGDVIQGGKKYRHQFRGRLDGINLVTQEDALVAFPLASVSSEDAHDFLGEKLTQIALKGRLTVPQGATAPFTVKYPKLAP